MKHLSVVAGLLLAMVSRAGAFEPQQLVGEWGGEWSASAQRGDLYITIKKVDADRVEGTVYIRGPQRYHNRDLPFVGKLEGSRFTATVPTMPGEPQVQLAFDVNAEATQMQGTAVGRGRADVTLTKKK